MRPGEQILTQNFLRKYILLAKKRFEHPNKPPILEEDAIEEISNIFKDLKEKGEESTVLPLTNRTVETLIRLATAHAKMRLSEKIERTDCKIAGDLLKFALFNEVA